MNPYDEWYALVRALELKEQHGGTVTAINVGPASNDVVIRKALAIGADDAVRIDTEALSAGQVAANIAGHAKDKGYDVIFTGKESIDYNGSEVGAMVAEHLGLPFVSYASHMDHSGQSATISRDIEGGVEVVEVTGPEAATVTDSKVSVVSYEMPPAKQGVKMIDAENMDELVRLLKEEAKVI